MGRNGPASSITRTRRFKIGHPPDPTTLSHRSTGPAQAMTQLNPLHSSLHLTQAARCPSAKHLCRAPSQPIGASQFQHDHHHIAQPSQPPRPPRPTCNSNQSMKHPVHHHRWNRKRRPALPPDNPGARGRRLSTTGGQRTTPSTAAAVAALG
jgi:hypothetical protein